MKKILLLVTTLVLLFQIIGCKRFYYKEAQSIVNKMTIDQKIGQLLIVAVPDTSMNYRTRWIIRKYNIGGVILFGYNITRNVKKYISDMQKYSMKVSKIPLFISTDQEGGRVVRFQKSITQFPSSMAVGIANDPYLTYNSAKILAIQLRNIGINMNYAPVMDVNNNPDNPVINTRSFSSDVTVVKRIGVSYIKGLQSGKCIAVAKHFPGHGDTNKDSHLTLPVIDYTLERLRKLELVPFSYAVNNGVEGVMTAHISYPKVLKNNEPATLSKFFLTDILRKEMRFSGIIITDDMEMKAIANEIKIEKAAVKTFAAGADIILLSTAGRKINKIFIAIKSAIKSGKISMKRLDNSVKRLLELKIRYNIMDIVKNKIVISKLKYSKDDISLLKESDKINKEITRKGLLYHGDKSILLQKKYTRAVISKNKQFRKLAERDFKHVHTSIFGFINNYSKKKNENVLVYYHIENKNVNEIPSIISIAEKSKFKVILISTGNPFKLTKFDPEVPILYSFSNTFESLNQVKNCIAGKFLPKFNAPLDLGFKEKKKKKNKKKNE